MINKIEFEKMIQNRVSRRVLVFSVNMRECQYLCVFFDTSVYFFSYFTCFVFLNYTISRTKKFDINFFQPVLQERDIQILVNTFKRKSFSRKDVTYRRRKKSQQKSQQKKKQKIREGEMRKKNFTLNRINERVSTILSIKIAGHGRIF